MPKTLTLSEPWLMKTIIGCRTVKWVLLDENNDGYFISWIEAAHDTMKPECMAFPVEHFQSDAQEIDWDSISWNEKAVSYNPDAALALDDVIEQLGDKYGYVFVIDPGTRQLFPGEMVARC